MSENETVVEEGQEEVETGELEQLGTETPKHTEAEEKALAQGWNPNHKGENFKTAEQFLKEGEKINAFLKERNDSLANKVIQLQKDQEAFRQDFHAFAQREQAVREKEIQRRVDGAKRELKAQMKKSVTEMDEDTYQAAEQELERLEKWEQEQEAQAKAEPQQEQLKPEVIEWTKKNEWYGSDRERTIYADSIVPFVAHNFPLLNFEQRLEKVRELTVKQFPQKFENPNREKPGTVGGDTPRSKGRKKTGSDLPPEAKQSIDRFVKRVPKDEQAKFRKELEQDYLKEYFGDEK